MQGQSKQQHNDKNIFLYTTPIQGMETACMEMPEHTMKDELPESSTKSETLEKEIVSLKKRLASYESEIARLKNQLERHENAEARKEHSGSLYADTINDELDETTLFRKKMFSRQKKQQCLKGIVMSMCIAAIVTFTVLATLV